jgi:hypothetical protein
MTDENKIYVLTDNQESKRIYLEILNSQFIGLKNKEIKLIYEFIKRQSLL